MSKLVWRVIGECQHAFMSEGDYGMVVIAYEIVANLMYKLDIQTAYDPSSFLKTFIGIKQRDSLSPLLFIIVVKEMVN